VRLHHHRRAAETPRLLPLHPRARRRVRATRAAHLEDELAALKARDARLLDAYLDGTAPAESYREKAENHVDERSGLELQLFDLAEAGDYASSLVEDRVRLAQSAQLAFANGDASTRREVVSQLLRNLTPKDGNIVSYR